MIIHNFDLQPSLVSQYLAEMRDISVQSDRLRFRRNLERLGEIFAYEISKTLEYKKLAVTTPLGVEAECGVIAEQIVLATIFRAGVPFHQGFLRYFDNAENAFVSAYRKYKEKENFDILIEYLASPRLDGKTLILCDPMLATGASMELSYKAPIKDNVFIYFNEVFLPLYMQPAILHNNTNTYCINLYTAIPRTDICRPLIARRCPIPLCL